MRYPACVRRLAVMLGAVACGAPSAPVQAPEESASLVIAASSTPNGGGGVPDPDPVKLPKPPPPVAEDRAAARAFFARGVQLYSQGSYDLALVEFEKAYGTAPVPQVLYNIGMCQERVGDEEAALHTYEKALADLDPGAPVRATLQQRVQALRQKLGLPP